MEKRHCEWSKGEYYLRIHCFGPDVEFLEPENLRTQIANRIS